MSHNYIDYTHIILCGESCPILFYMSYIYIIIDYTHIALRGESSHASNQLLQADSGTVVCVKQLEEVFCKALFAYQQEDSSHS